ncbi:hydroxyproline-rich glycoprotein family protein [Abeliophyllum distichum]|uniref:Hydroxyproline-rich glycoprotein family protein n=1 Tax=Abeliophyllum distichum TaxID=126358 RepID=A0ABD1RSL9_9LAMI
MEYPHGHHHRHDGRDRREEEYPPQARPPPPPFYGENQPPPPFYGENPPPPPFYGENEPPPPYYRENEPPPPYYRENEPPFPPPPQVTNVHHSSHIGGAEYPPPPPIVSHQSENNPRHHQHHPHFPSTVHHDSHENSKFANKPSVRVYSKAETNYSLTIRDGKVILSPSNPSDPFQHWIKDEKYSTRVKDEQGFPSFALINRATGQAIKHSIGATHPVQLIPYPDVLDESILWTESKDLGDGRKSALEHCSSLICGPALLSSVDCASWHAHMVEGFHHSEAYFLHVCW